MELREVRKMSAYTELQKKHHDELHAFPCFFAFNMEQFAEGMRSLGLRPKTDTKLIYRGIAGMYYRKSDAPALKEMLDRHTKEDRDAIESDSTGEGYILDMFSEELANHEYGITRDLSETLDVLGLTMDQVRASEALLHGLQKALERYNATV